MFNTIFNDIAHPWQLGFQDSASPGFSGIVDLHNTIFFYLVLIAVAVFWLLGSIIYFYSGSRQQIVHKYLNHGTILELVWTITPALILIAIAFPSFRLLYLLDEVTSPTVTIKVTGHQWYWSTSPLNLYLEGNSLILNSNIQQNFFSFIILKPLGL